MNLSKFLHNSPNNWVDLLGYHPISPRPATREELDARATLEERRQAAKRAMREGMEAYDNFLWEIIQKREAKTKVVIKEDAKDAGCECAEASIRTIGGGLMSHEIGDWDSLSEDVKDIPAFDAYKAYQVALFGGTCDHYDVDIEPSYDPSDKDELAKVGITKLSTKSTNGLGVRPRGVKVGEKTLIPRPLGDPDNMLLVTRDTTITHPFMRTVRLVIAIQIVGHLKNERNCCSRTYYIRGK